MIYNAQSVVNLPAFLFHTCTTTKKFKDIKNLPHLIGLFFLSLSVCVSFFNNKKGGGGGQKGLKEYP